MRRSSLCSGEPGKKSLVILPVVFSCFIFCLASCSRQPVYQQPLVEGTEVVIDAGTLGHEKPVFFTFPYHGRKINFFVFRTGEKVLSFLDACASCYSSKLGYHSENGSVICRKCDLRYSLSNIEQGFGNCFPIPLEGYLKGREYRIPVSRLQEAADKF